MRGYLPSGQPLLAKDVLSGGVRPRLGDGAFEPWITRLVRLTDYRRGLDRMRPLHQFFALQRFRTQIVRVLCFTVQLVSYRVKSRCPRLRAVNDVEFRYSGTLFLELLNSGRHIAPYVVYGAMCFLPRSCPPPFFS